MKCPKCGAEGTVCAEPEGCPMYKQPEREPILVERQKTHGSFGDNAIISQDIKRVYRRGDYELMEVRHKEALDMIALKLSRILSGQAKFKDHWDDIAGYAKLGSEACVD